MAKKAAKGDRSDEESSEQSSDEESTEESSSSNEQDWYYKYYKCFTILHNYLNVHESRVREKN